LQRLNNLVDVVARVKQDCNLGDVHRLGAKVVKIPTQQFNQALVIADTRLGTVGEKGEAEGVYCQMSLDAIDALVTTEPFGVDTRSASVIHGLRVDD